MKIYPNTHKTTRKNLKKSKKYRFTIIIPTFNRPEYLRRLLGYYARDGLDINCKIVIVDSSSEKNKSTNKETIHYFSNLDVLYLDNFSENIHPYIKQLFALGQVDTEYCVVCPDDDFILIDAINQAVDFFEKNPDYTCVHGRYIRFYLKGTDNYQFYWHFTYDPKSVIDSDPYTRINSYLECKSNVLFATYRTKFLKMIMEESETYVTQDSFFGELLQSILPFIYGKMKTLKVMYSPKDALSTPMNTNITHFSFLNDYKLNGTFDQKYASFLGCLSKHLSICSGQSIEESKKFLNLILLDYFETSNNTLGLILASSFHRVRIFLKSIKTPKFVYNLIRWPYQKLFIRERVKLLEEIPSSDYYRDLMNLKTYLITKTN